MAGSVQGLLPCAIVLFMLFGSTAMRERAAVVKENRNELLFQPLRLSWRQGELAVCRSDAVTEHVPLHL
eukprot:m.494133 g.494133  ORF g.494133 m.494133 type:complete len:69 (+) comp39572_c0_seq1:31-237(+)